MSSRRSARPPGYRASRGFSLMEALLATFVLLTSLLLSIYVFHSSLRAEASNEKRVVAAAVAESALAEVREAAGTNFRGLIGAYDGMEWSLPAEPDFKIHCQAKRSLVGLNCLELESQYDRASLFPDPEPRLLERSAVDIELRVSWNDPTERSITICERVVNLREISNFEVRLLDEGGADAAPLTVARGATARFKAQAYIDGQPLDDLQYTWYVAPVQGFGSLNAVSRDGLQCEYRNAYRNYANRLRYAPGVCYLTVEATFQGRTMTDKVRIDNDG